MIFPPEPSKEGVKVSHVIFECRVINHHPFAGPAQKNIILSESPPLFSYTLGDLFEWCDDIFGAVSLLAQVVDRLIHSVEPLLVH